ncbi:MAG: hypothetical protein COA84_15440 [Robiginitomaculum sp.]|nr:MAG: hypothetical protein COA84_15440 [Robiginitomaculum sp.]
MIIFVQNQVSQLDEPVYARMCELDESSCHVIYWNDYGIKRKEIDPELGRALNHADTLNYRYPYTWIDSRHHSWQKLYSETLALQPRLVVLSDIPRIARMKLALRLRANGITVALRSDKNSLSDTANTGLYKFFEQALTRLIFNALAPISQLTVQYYDWPKQRLCIPFPYTTNEKKFSPAMQIRLDGRKAIRKRFGLSKGDHVFLSAAKFVERENPWEIIKSFENVQRTRPNAALIAIGDGPLFSGVKAYCKDRNIHRVFFPGYVPFAELQDYFFAADTFLHFAKIEPWGVSPQDALIAGLGLITSVRVGSAQVHMTGPLNRFLIPLAQTEQYAERMIELSDQEDIYTLFESARQSAQEFTTAACAERWVRDLRR